MGWLILLLLGSASLIALWRFAGIGGATLQFLAAALMLAGAGYAWQGRPGLAGKPKPPPAQQQLPDSEFARTRGELLGEFDRASTWLTLAESYQRGGDTKAGADIIRSGLRQNPDNADLWVGLGNALVIHADGLMTPSAELAFRRASRLAPNHPGPKFFYGLALAQGGKFDEAEALWRNLLVTAPPEAQWRGMVEKRLLLLDQARSMGGVPVPAS